MITFMYKLCWLNRRRLVPSCCRAAHGPHDVVRGQLGAAPRAWRAGQPLGPPLARRRHLRPAERGPTTRRPTLLPLARSLFLTPFMKGTLTPPPPPMCVPKVLLKGKRVPSVFPRPVVSSTSLAVPTSRPEKRSEGDMGMEGGAGSITNRRYQRTPTANRHR